MTKKIAISESFARELDTSILSPGILSSDAKYLSGTLLLQPIRRINPSSELRQSLEAILSDIKLNYGDMFDKIPLMYLIPQSKAKKNAIWLAEEDDKGGFTNIKPILIISKNTDPNNKNIKNYTYIDLSSGNIVHANTPEASKKIEDNIKRMKIKVAKDLNKFIIESNQITELHKNFELNERMSLISQGNVTNLYSSIPMLKKCLALLTQRISRQEGMINFFKSKKEEIKDKSKGEKEKFIYEQLREKIKKELQNPVHVNNEKDFLQMLHVLYREPSERRKIDIDLSSGKFNVVKDKLSITENRMNDLINALKRILSSFDAFEDSKNYRDEEYTEKRKKKSLKPSELPGDHPIFGQLPTLEESSFEEKLPGNFAGHQSFGHYMASFDRKEYGMEGTKLPALKVMKEGVQKIIDNFSNQILNNKKINVCNFSISDMAYLRNARSEAMSLLSSYSHDLLVIDKKTKEKRFDKRKIGSIFEDTAEDLMVARYVAITIRYIEMVFTKTNCTKKK